MKLAVKKALLLVRREVRKYPGSTRRVLMPKGLTSSSSDSTRPAWLLEFTDGVLRGIEMLTSNCEFGSAIGSCHGAAAPSGN